MRAGPVKSSMSRRILFLIRGKLGDSLVAFATLNLFLARNPDVEAVLAIRKDYVPLVAGDARARVIPFGSRIELMARLLVERLRGRRFDVLAVLWGFGGIVDSVARLAGAPRRIYLDGRQPRHFPEWPQPAFDERILDPGWRVLRLLDPELPRPERLDLPALAARRAPENTVLIAPVADEFRRSLDAASCAAFVRHVSSRHPGAEIRVMVNPRDTAAAVIEQMALPAGACLLRFGTLAEVVAAFGRAYAWYGVDTGLFHLATAMGLPVTVLFGSSRPLKTLLPRQPDATWLRLAALAADDCFVAACTQPHCLHRLVGILAAEPPTSTLDATLDACPLRGKAPEQLDTLISNR